MNIPAMYGYLQRSRRDLWAALEALPDEVLSRPLLSGERFHCVKDLMFHIAAVEDGWVNEDIQGESPVRTKFPVLDETPWEPVFAQVPLVELLDYWKAVEAGTLRYLAALSEQETERIFALHDAPEERYTVDSVLWHVMLHEVRHTAQIAMLLRLQGIKPPSLDLLFYLPLP